MKRDTLHEWLLRNVMLIAVVLSIAYWCVEATIDTYIFGKGEGLVHSIFQSNRHEIWMRILAIVVFMGSALVMDRLIKRQKQMETVLAHEARFNQSILDTVSALVIVIDRAGVVTV